MVINVWSMLTVRNGNYPVKLLNERVLGCNHFDYFVDIEGRAQLLEWLKLAWSPKEISRKEGNE
jgi:hypothetical protein